MAKSTVKTAGAGKSRGASAAGKAMIERDSRTGPFRTGQGHVKSVMEAAERSGLLTGKSSRIAGRVSPELVEQAKRRTGIEADIDLIAFALANVALEDDFAEAFKDARGKIDPDLKLGF